MLGKSSDDSHHLFKPEFLRSYISLSKSYTPTISEELHELLINKYIEQRRDQQSLQKQGDKYVTTRSLLALIRLCQARVAIFLFRQDCDSPTRSASGTSPSALKSWRRVRRTWGWSTSNANPCMTSPLKYSTSSRISASTPQN